MQANGAEMLRLACCYSTERGIKVCAPVHDAILIEFDLEDEEANIASACVLDGFELRTDVKIVRHPDRYMDERGTKMWDTVGEIINRLPE
jgi:DNA polymerase-1